MLLHRPDHSKGFDSESAVCGFRDARFSRMYYMHMPSFNLPNDCTSQYCIELYAYYIIDRSLKINSISNSSEGLEARHHRYLGHS